MPEHDFARDLQEACLRTLSLIRDEVDGLFSRHGSGKPDITPTLKTLFWYLSSRSQAVSFLASWGYAWDAEIILRSFYETAAKILLLCFAEEGEKPTLVDEFWNKLGPINDRRTAKKAAHAERVFEPNSVSASVFGLLQDGKVFDLETEGSKAERKRLEQKWSFSEIIDKLSRSAPDGKSLQDITALLHTYGMASHLAHADNAAMDLMQDRALRDPEECKILEAGHLSRIMTDQVSISWFCADALRRHFGADFADAVKLREAFEQTLRLSRPFQTAFDKSQREFYARWLEGTV